MKAQDDDIVGAIGAAPVCKTCGSESVVKDAWACWNPQFGLWELEVVFDGEYCRHCERETTFAWRRVESVPNLRIRELNDRFRREGRGQGSIVVTAGVQQRGADFVLRAVEQVRAFDQFSDGNDPWGEHDFGAVEIGVERIFWKIDYYDPTLTSGSENAANEAETHRVLTILLPEEY